MRRHARTQGDKTAVIFYHGEGAARKRETKTFSQLNEEANRLASSFRALGLQKGDVVAVMSRNSPDFIVCWYACLKSGIVMSSVNITYTEKELSYQLGHARPSLILVEPLFIPRIESTMKQANAAFGFIKHLVASDAAIPVSGVPRKAGRACGS